MAAAILDPETVFQMSDAGVPLPQLLAARGILPGVKPSLKVYKLPGCDGETVMLLGRDSLILSLILSRILSLILSLSLSPSLSLSLSLTRWCTA